MQKELPIPNFSVEGNKEDPNFSSKVDLQEKARLWKETHGIKPAYGDADKVQLLVIDAQEDFCFPDGSLFVGGRSGKGAIDDNGRLSNFIYRNLQNISQITCTMDTHNVFQIFHPTAHVRSDGSHPDPGTVITYDEYASNKYQANPEMASQMNASPTWLTKQFIHYTKELSQGNRYPLTIWPYHCILGSSGHKLAGIIDEARKFHSLTRGVPNNPEIKGGNPLTEHYSIFKPEVMTCWDGRPIPGAQRNKNLIDSMMTKDKIIIAGQAMSHCVAWSIKDLMEEILSTNKEMMSKIYIMTDCTSPVVIPNVVDYTEEAEKSFSEFANAGMQLVKSTDPIETWD